MKFRSDSPTSPGNLLRLCPTWALGIKLLPPQFVSTFSDGEEITRSFQVRPVSPFEYTAPPSVFALIDNVAPL
jgi:hypothetical protein